MIQCHLLGYLSGARGQEVVRIVDLKLKQVTEKKSFGFEPACLGSPCRKLD